MWHGEDYIGLGPAAASRLGLVRRTNAPDLSAWASALDAGRPPPADEESLSPEDDEHERFVAFTVESTAALFDLNRYARYVAVFQNWLRPAGASFDHLHKQLVAIDERGVQHELAMERLRANPKPCGQQAETRHTSHYDP